MACGFWDIDIPKVTHLVANKGMSHIVWLIAQILAYQSAYHKIISGNKIVPEGYEEKIAIEDLQLGMRFHADMLNRVWFVVIILVICVAFCTTFVLSWTY